MLAAYASDPDLAAMRLDFTEVMRRTAEVTISGAPRPPERADARARAPERRQTRRFGRIGHAVQTF